jgi:hypothetical protein
MEASTLREAEAPTDLLPRERIVERLTEYAEAPEAARRAQATAVSFTILEILSTIYLYPPKKH